jgi:hypothetical protein
MCGNPFTIRWHGGRPTTCCGDVCRFWSRVTITDDCWLWTGQRFVNTNYPRFSLGGRALGGHVYAYTLLHGAVPPGREVCHTCGNRQCVRPEHLYAGTHSENMRDMVRHGRYTQPPLASLRRGPSNPAWKHGRYAKARAQEEVA